jgi:hypothetical protein
LICSYLEAARRSNIPHFVETFFDDFSILSDAIARNVSDNRQVAEQHQFARAREHGLRENDLVYKAEFSHQARNKLQIIAEIFRALQNTKFDWPKQCEVARHSDRQNSQASS